MDGAPATSDRTFAMQEHHNSSSAGRSLSGGPLPPPHGHQSWAGAIASTSEIPYTDDGSARKRRAQIPDFTSHPAFSFEGPHDRKTKSVQSCTECRRRKIKCDRVFPCGPCKIRNEASSCEEYVKTKVSEPSGYTLVSDFRILANRMERLEDFLQSVYGNAAHPNDLTEDRHEVLDPISNDFEALNQLQDNLTWDNSFLPFPDQENNGNVHALSSALVSASLPPLQPSMGVEGEAGQFQPPIFAFGDRLLPNLPAGEPTASTSGTSLPHDVVHEPTASANQSRSPSPGDTDHEAALALEDMALNRYHARLKTLFAGTPAFSFRYLPPPSLGPLVSLQSILSDWRKMPVLLPGLHSLRLLATDYVNRYLWIQRCLHVPSFKHELETFLTSAAERGGDIYFKPKHVPFVSLLFAACATSIHFASNDDISRYGMHPDNQVPACTQWVDAALTLLQKAEWLQVHDVMPLQTVLVLGPILAATDRGEMHWALIGSAIKVAQAMNFCNLVPESVFLGKSAHPLALVQGNSRASMPLAREIGRRVWSHLVEIDWLFASEHNYAYAIHPTQNRTAEVSNVNDGELTLAIEIKPLPEHVWTESTYTIWKDRMIHPYREFTDDCQTSRKPALTLIQECDAKLNKLAENLPFFYQLHTDLTATFPGAEVENQVRVERIAIQSGLHTRLLRVHRTVLRRAYRNHKYDSSREACIRSSKMLLHLAEEWLKSNMAVSGWWPISYGIYSASVILFITMCRDESLVESHESSIIRAISVIRALPGPVSAKRGHMASMLEKLLAGRRKKLTSQTTVPSKRKYTQQSDVVDKVTPSEDQMDQFVARLVAKTPTSTTDTLAPEQRLDGGSFVDTGFHVGDGLNTFDFNFDFGAYDDPFADIMRMTEASLSTNPAIKNQALWPWN